ncbi:MAG: hypothetical protein HY392_01910 [Candidatus Diapherotrites archaeon]|nr:hypothetical protein [Candidatus Diapherotrites archaeon]
MYTVQKQKSAYSKMDIAKLRKISRDIKEAKKDPAFRKAIDDFIKATT